jgi:hypothetical protein
MPLRYALCIKRLWKKLPQVSMICICFLLAPFTSPQTVPAAFQLANPVISVVGICDNKGNGTFTITNTGEAMTVNYTWEIYQDGSYLTSGLFSLTASAPGNTMQIAIHGLYGTLRVDIKDDHQAVIASGTAFCAFPTATQTSTPTSTPTPTPTSTPTSTPTPTITLVPPEITVIGICDSQGNATFTITNTGAAMTVNYTWEILRNGNFITSGLFSLTASAPGNTLQLLITELYGNLRVNIKDDYQALIATATAFCVSPTGTPTRPPTITNTPTQTHTPSAAASFTPTASITPTETMTNTPTLTPTFTMTPSRTATSTPMPVPNLVLTMQSPDPSVVGEAVMFSYELSGIFSPSGIVTLTDGTDSCTGTASGGSCSIRFTTPGSKLVTAAYNDGTPSHNITSAGVSHQVNQANTTSSLSVKESAGIFGTPVTLYAVVAVTTPGAGLPSGSVNFFAGGNLIGSGVLDADGTARLVLSSPPHGLISMMVSYEGDQNFAASQETSKVFIPWRLDLPLIYNYY